MTSRILSVMANASGPRPRPTDSTFAPGVYVKAPDGGKQRPARIVAGDGGKLVVQFYDYCDKRTVKLDVNRLLKSDRTVNNLKGGVAGGKPDCEVEWQGTWYAAKVQKNENGKHYIFRTSVTTVPGTSGWETTAFVSTRKKTFHVRSNPAHSDSAC